VPPLVTVVTPFYNTARYLAECIDSVLAQSYEQWEYLLVDNCSTDGSAEIARSYAARDPRIRVIPNPTHLSQVANYNAALAHVGPAAAFCKVVQADDWLFPDCLREMVAVADAHPRVGLVSSYRIKGTELTNVGIPYPVTVIAGREICRRHLQESVFLFGSATSVMFRADIVRARVPFYAEGRLHEDTDACYEILEHADFGFVHQVLSFSRVETNSISGRARDHGPAYLDRVIALETHGPRYLSPAELDASRRQWWSLYYEILGKGLLNGRDQDFWAYHERGLRTIGRSISRPRVWGGAIRALFRR
jgi:glycosyltransferase involved in cell wall biosynthesis